MLYQQTVQAALGEDIGAGDITTALCIPVDARASAALVAKSPGVIAGLEIAACAFRLLDPDALWNPEVADGFAVHQCPQRLGTITGNARALLTAERVALNFLQHLSGIATMTARYVEAVKGTNARIVDTRKTTPGLRALEKYAVRVGGGFNHRLGLYDCVLIKDNHILAAGSITQAVAQVKRSLSHTMKLEVETDTLAQVEEALSAGADIILLDNMNHEDLRRAVRIIAGRAITEASGGLTLDKVAAVAAAGVDILSVGALTHSAPALDISLDFAL
jgi:nicotinate-nucleotide pyrophosphorylase (carboxylating)